MGKKTSVQHLADELNEILTEYAYATSDGVKEAVQKTSKEVKTKVQAGAPVRTGQYKKSWAEKKMKETSNALTMVVYSRNRYQLAHLLEHGHAKRGGGRTRAFPHIAPAEQEGIQMLEEEIKRSIRNG